MATEITTENIIIGPARLLAGEYGCEDLDLVDLGGTTGGVTVSMSRTFYDVEADQAIGILKRQETGRTMKVSTTLLEATLSNLALAWGYGADAVTVDEVSGKTTFNIGNVTEIPYKRLRFIGPGPEGQERTYDVHKVASVGDGSHDLRKESETGIPVEFEVLYDASQTGPDKFGKVVDAKPAP